MRAHHLNCGTFTPPFTLRVLNATAGVTVIPAHDKRILDDLIALGAGRT